MSEMDLRIKWVRLTASEDKIECSFSPFGKASLRYKYRTVTPQWLACYFVNGDPGEGQVPVKICRSLGCVNGNHYRWGTMEEAQRGRSLPDRSGERNPRSKLTALEVSQLRAVNWGNGHYKLQAADAAGIEPKTLAAILGGRLWVGVKPYVSIKDKSEGDEF